MTGLRAAIAPFTRSPALPPNLLTRKDACNCLTALRLQTMTWAAQDSEPSTRAL
jgi:hypothetical protein